MGEINYVCIYCTTDGRLSEFMYTLHACGTVKPGSNGLPRSLNVFPFQRLFCLTHALTRTGCDAQRTTS